MNARFFVVFSASFLMATSTVRAGVVTFDDLSTTVGTGNPIPNGYSGLNWLNLIWVTAPGSAPASSGYGHGLVSSPNEAYNGGGSPASISSATPFNFVSGFFTAAWNDGLQITVTGLNGINTVGTVTF